MGCLSSQIKFTGKINLKIDVLDFSKQTLRGSIQILTRDSLQGAKIICNLVGIENDGTDSKCCYFKNLLIKEFSQSSRNEHHSFPLFRGDIVRPQMNTNLCIVGNLNLSTFFYIEVYLTEREHNYPQINSYTSDINDYHIKSTRVIHVIPVYHQIMVMKSIEVERPNVLIYIEKNVYKVGEIIQGHIKVNAPMKECNFQIERQIFETFTESQKKKPNLQSKVIFSQDFGNSLQGKNIFKINYPLSSMFYQGLSYQSSNYKVLYICSVETRFLDDKIERLGETITVQQNFRQGDYR